MKITVKLLFSLVCVALLTALLTNCNDDSLSVEKTLEIETTASAKAEDDIKPSGVYKGTFVGSTGTFKLIIQFDMVTGVLTLDGGRYQLSTSDIDVDNMESGITDALFMNDDGRIKLWFSVGANGENPTAKLDIEGHSNIQAVVLKETSTSQVKVFEGFRYCSYPNEGIQVKGTINVVLDVDSLISVAYKTDSFISLNNGNSGTVPEEAWVSTGIYYNDNIFGDNDLIISYLTGQKNLICSGDYRYYFTDVEISQVFEWTYQEITYTDSVRLVRKL